MELSIEPSKIEFDFGRAMSRNLGWLTPAEQLKLANTHIGLVGVGGVGGQYAEVLTRLGVSKFTIFDPDRFSMENTNRQNGCQISNYNKNKAEIVGNLIKDINPTAEVTVFPRAFKVEDVEPFCSRIDIYLDTLDFFETDLRILIFNKMRSLGKYSLTAAPLGTGSSCIVFAPNSMSFSNYFGLERSSDVKSRSLMFLLGLSPTLQQIQYLQDRSFVDMTSKKVPSLPMGVYSCASVMATSVLKIVLNRGEVLCSPWSVHYDPYLNRIKKRYLLWGYRNPFQLLKLFIAKHFLR